MSTPTLSPPSPSGRDRSRLFGMFFPAALLALLPMQAAAGQPPAAGATPAVKAAPSPGRALAPGDNGPAIEDLQRRLNARLDPSPGLDIDGDYGDATRAAVARFQRSQDLGPTGIADARTLRALGTDPFAVPLVPAPEVINAQLPPRLPADSLDGPPFVTAKAWAIADGKTGAILKGDREGEPLPMASTTKLMTSLVVLRLMERHPGAADELVTFSERADRTPGSSATVRAGERLPVRELLYGLLLPSGNDAAVALAEHFGGRLAPPAEAPGETDPLARFVAEMNRVAVESGLRETRFANPHGLPASAHHASARDLATLARHALAFPDFARVVSTSRHGCTLVDAEGHKRNVAWTNTNRLLGTAGYDGIKTGTTTAAGACLVASGRRGDDHLIVVILGAGSSEARYTDARNLFRWGWLRRGDALQPPPINSRPGPEYADDTRAFQGIPGIERAANGRLWALWYAGGQGEGGANYVLLVSSGDNGKTWSGPRLVIDPPGQVRAYDPCLWHDPQGRMWLFWAQSYDWWDGRSGVWSIVTDDSGNENPRWSEPRRLADGIMMNKPTVLTTGEWLMPAALWERKPSTAMAHQHDLGERSGANVLVSRDRGATWDALGRVIVPNRVFDEHSIVERRDGSLWTLVRAAYGIGESLSNDRGKSWTEGRRSSIPNVNSRFFIRRLNSGKLLLVTHNPPDQKSRSHLIAHLSDDDGKAWRGGLMIDIRAGVSYPDGVQAPDGTIYLIYDFERTRQKQILMATFTEDDVATGEWSSPSARQRVVIDQATGTRAK